MGAAGGRCDEGETPARRRCASFTKNSLSSADDVLGCSTITPPVPLSHHACGVWAAASAESRLSCEVASVHRIALDDIEQAAAFDFVTIPQSTRA